jgi:hypothetical protein
VNGKKEIPEITAGSGMARPFYLARPGNDDGADPKQGYGFFLREVLDQPEADRWRRKSREIAMGWNLGYWNMD